MKLIKMQCPTCGADLDIDPNNGMAFCPYCGAKLLIDDESINVNINYNDEARKMEAQIKQDQFAILQQQYAAEDQQYEEDLKKWNEQYARWKKTVPVAPLCIIGLFLVSQFWPFSEKHFIVSAVGDLLLIVFFLAVLISGTYTIYRRITLNRGHPTPAHEKALEKRKQEMIKIMQNQSE